MVAVLAPGDDPRLGKNGQVGPVSQAERDAAVTVQTSTKAFSSPDAAFVNGVFQTQAGQAIQVAQFVTGGPLPTTVSPTPTPTAAGTAAARAL